ncbi:hypothetical protein C8Q80DRAFT_67726 [Daedaleopsis nitida]|nr:hypothetical protein C8Q80DRAFT_67726 [Daedaleopsis nitida]
MLVTVTIRVRAALRVRSRPHCLPPQHHSRAITFTTMGRQQTLGKFFGKTGDPPVQSTLEDAFGGKRKRSTKSSSKAKEKPSGDKGEEPGKGRRRPPKQYLPRRNVA